MMPHHTPTLPHHLRILYLEDDPGLTALVEAQLTPYRPHVRAASSVRAAVQALTTEPLPDIILCDIMMPYEDGPYEDGYAFFEQVRARRDWRLIPFVFVTALGSDRHLRHGMNLGADGYLAKPFTEAQLLSELSLVLARHAELRRETRFTLTLLGGQSVRQDGALLSAPDRGAEGLVFFLLCEAGHAERETLIAELWGNLSRSGFRSVVSRARRWLSGWGELTLTQTHLTLTLARQVQCDLHALEAALTAGLRGEQLRALYPGPLLPSHQDDWAFARRETLARRVKGVLLEDAARAANAREGALRLRDALAVDLLDLELWSRYIERLEAAGLRSESEQARAHLDSLL